MLRIVNKKAFISISIRTSVSEYKCNKLKNVEAIPVVRITYRIHEQNDLYLNRQHYQWVTITHPRPSWQSPRPRNVRSWIRHWAIRKQHPDKIAQWREPHTDIIW